MGRIKVLDLTAEQQSELEKGFRKGKNHAFRKRCQLVLLKEEGRSSQEVASIVKMCEMSVNNWLSRYALEGITGLVTKPGRGRKPKLNPLTDSAPVVAVVKANRQRLLAAKAEFEAGGGSKVSRETLPF
jgi:predicted ArsR family transcriptional regulator